MARNQATLSSRRGEYGFDAPLVPAMLGAGGVALLAVAAFAAARGPKALAALTGLGGAEMLLSTASFLYTTRRGKFAAWAEILAGLNLRGDEQLLDLGCGRGAVLLLAAQQLPKGRAVGIDLWRSVDQSGNDPETTRRNAQLEGVGDRVELQTGDMRDLPFADGSFDVIVSSLAITISRTWRGGQRRSMRRCACFGRVGGW